MECVKDFEKLVLRIEKSLLGIRQKLTPIVAFHFPSKELKINKFGKKTTLKYVKCVC